MADSITNAPLGYNNEGDSIVAPQRADTILSPAGLDENTAGTKAMAYSEIAGANRSGTDKKAIRESVRQSLIALGSDPKVDELEEQLTATRQMRHTETSVESILNARFGVDDAILAVSDSVKAGHLTVEDELLIRYSDSANSESGVLLDESNSIATFNYNDWVNRTNEERFAVDAAVSGVVAGLDPSYQSLTGDFLAEAAPFALGIFSAKLAADISEAQGGSFLDNFVARIRGFMAPGEIRNDIRKLVMSVDPTERPEYAAQLAQQIKQRSGIIFDNDTETIDWIEHVISSADERQNDPSFDWDRTLYNLITLLDAIPFLSRGIKGANTGLRSFFGEAGRLNRKRARDVLLDSIDDPQSLKGLVPDVDEVVSSQLPKTTREALDSAPSVVSEQLELALDNVGNVVRATDNTAINYTAGEVDGVVERLAAAYQSVKGGVLNINKFVVDVSNGDRILTDAFYSRTKNEGGWLSPKSALNAAEKIADGDLSRVTLLVRNADGGFDRMLTGPELRSTFGKSKASAHDGNEYFVQVRDTHYLSETDKMAFGGEPVFFTGPFGSGRFLGDATAQFSRDIWEPSFAALGRETEFNRSVIKLAKQFWDLPRGGRNRVTRLLEQGSKDKRTYTVAELVEVSDRLEGGISALTVGDVKGYYAMRAANDAVWATANRQVFKDLQASGFRTLSKQDNTLSWVTRPYQASDGPVNRALNPKTGEIVDVTPELVAQWEKKGGGVEVLHSNASHHVKNEETFFVIRDGGVGTQLSPLPITPLKYEAGYVSRIYKDEFFVNRVSNVLRNGTKQESLRAVHTARTLKEAEEVAAQLTDSTGQLHKTNTTVTGGANRLVDDTMLIEQDRLVFGSRIDDPVTRAGTDQAMLADPIESLHRAVSATGRSVGIENYVRNQEVSFFKTYQDIITPSVWRDYRASRFGASGVADDLRRAADRLIGADSERALQALQLWQYYRMLRGVNEPRIMRGWRAGVRNMADKLERKFGLSPGTGKFLADLGEHDPFGLAKGIVFNTLITANPVRQYALQSAQFAYLMGANPRVAISAVRHAAVLRMGWSHIDTPHWDSWKHGIAKAMNLSEEEVEIMIRQFKDSGLVAEIDSYGYMGTVLTDKNVTYQPRAFRAALQTAGNIARKPFQIAKSAGFNAGEINNLSFTYTFALKEYLAKTGKRITDLSPREWQALGSQASGYALSMHKAGTLGYQQGFLSIITQFWSIGHKAMAGMLPGRYGSKAFTGNQKVGIIATQLGLYGAAGLGIHEVVQGIITETGVLDNVPQDKAQQITQLITNGAGEMLLNHMLSEDDGEVDMAFSTSFAPASGAVSTVQDFIITAIDLDVVSSLKRQTAAGSTLGRYTDMFDYIDYTLGMSTTLPNTPSKLERIMTVSPTVFSGWSNAQKAFYAMRTGQLVSTYGDVRSHISYREAIIKGLFGVQTNEEADVQRLMGLDGSAFNFDANDAEEWANSIYKAMNRNLLAFEGSGDFNFTRAAAAVEGERIILEMLEPHEAEMVRAAFLDLAIDKRGDPDDVLIRVIEFARRGAISPEKMYSEIRSVLADPIYDEERDAALALAKDMIEGRNDRVEWYRENNKELDEEDNQYLLQDTGF